MDRAVDKTGARATALRRAALAAAALASLSFSTGCGLLRATAQAPGNITRAMLPGDDEREAMEPAAQQAELMRLCEGSLQTLDGAFSEFAEQAGTDEARFQAAHFRLTASQRLFAIATRPDSIPALLDLIVLFELSEASLQRRVRPDQWGEPARPILDAVTAARDLAWGLAARMLGEDQLARARKAIAAWAEGLGEIDEDTPLSPPSIEEIARMADPESSGGLAALFTLDPFSGLEPTTREIALARLFAERALFMGKHMPELVRAQLELAALQARRQPETVQVLHGVENVSAAAQGIAEVADELPEFLSKEREAAIQQALDGLTAQREGLVRDLEAAEEPLDQILVSSRATLEAAQATSTRLSELVTTVDTFLDRFDEPDDAPPEPDETPARPFDITEYGSAVAEVGVSARELTTLVAELERNLPEVERIADVAAQRAEKAIDHAFVRGLQLGLALIAATALAVFALRRRRPRRVESA